MKKIFLLSGHSQRFLDKGYPIKPLVQVGKNLVIEMNVSMTREPSFDHPDDYSDCYFIIKESDETNYRLSEYLKEEFPWCNVIAIKDHPDGPVVSVLQALKDIPDDEEDEGYLFIYNDLYIPWDYEKFAAFIKIHNPDGLMVYHKGFHPHTAYNKSFCHLRMEGSKVLEVKEKGHFTDDQLNEPSSSGIYYFKRRQLVQKYFDELVNNEERVNNEFYITVPYNFMIRDGLNVMGYKATKYISFGVPEDVEIYNYYYNLFLK